MSPLSKLVITFLLGVIAPSAFANADSQSIQVQDIREQQSKLQIDVRSGRGAFKDMSESDRKNLLSKQERVLLLLQDKSNVDELAPDVKIEVFNILEEIKSTVSNAEDNRMVCRKDRVVGSNLPQTVCMTAKEERQRRERTRDAIRRGQGCTSSDCVIAGSNR